MNPKTVPEIEIWASAAQVPSRNDTIGFDREIAFGHDPDVDLDYGSGSVCLTKTPTFQSIIWSGSRSIF